MEIQLTKDADKLICSIYKEYLTRRKNGMPKADSRVFNAPGTWNNSLLAGLSADDVHDTSNELADIDFIKKYVDGSFVLKDAAIIYMENRFPNGLAQVAEWLLKTITAIPF